MSKLKSNYVMVPTALIKAGLSASEFKVMLYLLSWQHSEKGCFVKLYTISDACDIALATTKKAVKKLVKEKFITVSSGKSERRANTYVINFAVIDDRCVFTNEENELRNIEFNKKQALKVTPREIELRESLSKAGNS